jgi:dTDP-4-amino-4,6-dideoxygalactose transaminase
MKPATACAASRKLRVFDIVEEFWPPEMFRKARRQADDQPDVAERFEQAFLRHAQLQGEAAFVASARQGLQCLLEALADEKRSEVVLPAFCCEVNAQAVLDAGKRPVLVDSGPSPGSIDFVQCEEILRKRDVLAVLLPHLYGLPVDCGEFAAFATSRGVVVIEDCAQTLGASWAGKPVGSVGDFSIHSFNSFKPMSLAGGGMLVANSAARGRVDIENLRRRSEAPSHDRELEETAAFERALRIRRKAIAERNGPSLKGALWRGLHRLPDPVRSGLRKAVNQFRSRTARGEVTLASGAGSIRAAAGLACLEKYPEVAARRRSNLEFLAVLLAGLPGLSLLTPAPGACASPLFAKAVVGPGAARRIPELEQRLLRGGFVGGRFHWHKTIDQQPTIGRRCVLAGPLENAHRAAACGIDLPIHQNMQPEDLEHMAGILAEVLS